MLDILKVLSQDSFLLISIVLTTAVSMMYSIVVKKINRNARIRELELKNIMAEIENSKSEEKIKNVIERMPEGVQEDEFFRRLKKEMLEVSYVQLQDDKKVNEDTSLYKFLESHHRQALLQSSVQFWFSIFAAFIGFTFIIVMIFTTSDAVWYEYVVKILPGAIIDAISVLFFNQAHETRDRAANFFKELTYDKQVAKSVAIAEAIEDKEIKARVQSKIALHIIGLSVAEINNSDTK